MGQYYMPILIREKGIRSFYSWDFDNGLKLMEHSYIGNNFVAAVIHDIKINGPARLFWMGDYIEQDDLDEKNIIDITANDLKNIYYDKYLQEDNKTSLTCKEPADINEFQKEYYLINRTKNIAIYVDGRFLGGGLDNFSMVHPLPLLTCTDNHSGGSYYSDYGQYLISTWCGDEIEYSDERPDCKIIKYVFVEEFETFMVHNHPDCKPYVIRSNEHIYDLEQFKYFTKEEAINNLVSMFKWKENAYEETLYYIISYNDHLKDLAFQPMNELEYYAEDGHLLDLINGLSSNFDTKDPYFIENDGYFRSYSEEKKKHLLNNSMEKVAGELIDFWNEYKDSNFKSWNCYEQIKNIIEFIKE